MKIGFIGLGIMGESMCANIIKKHDDKVYVFDFVKTQVDKLVSLGAIACENSREVAEKSDVIISMVPKSEHSRSVYEEVGKVTDSSKICIDMSTIDPSVSVEISKMIKKTGAQFADAPVVKSKPAAIAGKLGIYVGCDEELFDKLCSLYGVGKKVANCTMLFGFYRLDSFPIDVWMNKIQDKYYPEGFPIEAYRPYGGVMQQYMFAYERSIDF